MQCPSCQFKNNENSNFCTQCGTPLIPVCMICHTIANKDDLYCAICGTRLIMANLAISKSSTAPINNNIKKQIDPSLSSINSQRKTVTVVFADISGFTAMSEKLDPEEVTTIMNKCLGIMGDCVVKYEGYIDKFIGDCIMAIFGAPITHENDPQLAILAAIDMNKKITEFNKELPIKLDKPLTLHIGINTGLVVAGNMGSDSRMDYTVMGDTVNLASRLESKAVNGQIFISAYTYNQTKNFFEFIKHEPVEVKGKRDPVDVYEVGRKLEDSEIKNNVSVDVPIIGRQKELDMLTSSVNRLKDGEGQAIFLVSDPGFGKSRVQLELKKIFKKGEVQFIEGQAHSFSRNTPYLIFIDIFKRLCSIDSDDLAQTMIDKFSTGLILLLGEDKDFLTIEAKKAVVLIGKLLNLDISEQFDISIKEMSLQEINTATIRAISWVFTKFCHTHPVVLSLENLHHADIASIEIINSLINVANSHPIMLLLLFRPDKNAPSSKLTLYARKVLADRSVEVTFDRLTRDDCESLVHCILESDNIPKELLNLIGSKSDGNPLFLQEIIRSLIDNNTIEKQDSGEIKILEKLDYITIPDSIIGLIMSRFDQLSEELKEILNIASVIGPSFSFGLISELINENSLEESLDLLIDAEMIFESSSFPDIRYSFHTTYIQEAVYSTLLLKRRRSIHLNVAESITKINSNEIDHVESLAYHYYEANNMTKAYKYHVESGFKSKNIFANETASKFFSKAIEIGSKLKNPKPSITTLNTAYSEILELMGYMENAIEAWKRVIDGEDDILIKANAMRNIGRIEEKRGYKETAIKIYEEALDLIKDKSDSLEYGMLLMNISWVLNRFRKVDEAIDRANKALELFDKIDSQDNIALCCNNLAVFYENKQSYDVSLQFNQRSLSLFKETHNRRQIGNVELSLGYLYNKRGEMNEALEHFTLSATAMDMIGNSVGIATALLAKGRCFEDMKRYDEAEIALLSALRQYRELDMDRRLVATDVTLINVLLDKKDVIDAYKHIEEAMKIANKHNFKSDIGKLNRLWGRTLRYEGKEEEAKQKYEDAFKVFTELGREKDANSVKKELG